MERKRIDVAGGAAKPAAAVARGGSSGGSASDKKKNLILLSVAGVAFLVAGYFIYANYFATPGAPADAAAPAMDSTFEEAAKVPPPPTDSEPMPEKGIGKRMTPGG